MDAPAATTPPARPPSWWSRTWHALARLLAWGVVVVAVFIVGAAWLASREATVRWVADQVAQASGGRIVLQGVHGSLIEGVSIERVEYDAPESAVSIDHLVVNWFWLPPRLVQVNALEAARVRVEVRQTSNEPPKPPASLAVPLYLRITRIAVGELIVARPQGEPVRIAGIAGAARANDRRLAVELGHAEVAGLVLAGAARLGAQAPFDTKIDLNATLPGLPMIAGLVLHANGPLEKLEVSAQGRFSDKNASPVLARTTVQPFTAAPLGVIEAQAEAVPLTTFGVTMPEAVLAAKAKLGIDTQGVFGGAVELRNAKPGGMHERRVPIEAASAMLSITGAGVAFDRLVAQTREGGRLEGRITVDGGKGTRIDLTASNVSLKTVHANLVPVRVSGPVEVEIAGGEVHAKTRLKGGELELATTLALARGELAFAPLRLSAGRGQVEGQARLVLGGTQKFTLTATATGFEPARVLAAVDPQAPPPAWLDARLNGRVQADGTLAPEPALRIDLALANSVLAGMPIDGNVRGRVATRGGLTLDDVEAQLHMAENEFIARGGFGSGGSVLSYGLRAPRLDRIARVWGVSLAGAAEVHGTVIGTESDPVIVVALDARELRLGQGKTAIGIAKLGGDAEIQGGRVRSDFLATAIDTGDAKFEQATLAARGGVADHRIEAQARGSAFGRPVRARLDAEGGWRTEGAESAWQGRILHIENEGRLAVRLLAPVPVSIGTARQSLGEMALAVAGGRVMAETVERIGGRITTRGRLEGLAVQALARWFPALETPKSTLTLDGRWDVALDEHIDARLHLERAAGDLWVSTVASGALGVERLALDAEIARDEVRAQADFSARRAGSLKAELSTALSRRDGAWGIAGSAPFEWSLDGELSSLAWLGLLAETPLNAEGSIRVQARRRGPLADPELSGTVTGERLALRTFDPRAQLTDGRLRLVFDSRRIALEEFVFAGRGGQLAASGIVDLPSPGSADGVRGTVDIAFDHLDALTDPLYHVVASGAVRVAVAQGQSTVTGRLLADRARITLRDTMAPTLGKDVVLIRGDDDGEPDLARKPFPVTVDLAFDLGDQFEITGYGAEATLAGALEIAARAGQPLRTKGNIETTRGTYYAYGTKLNITRGALSFSGPIDNPGLHVRAERSDLPVVVGVEVTGSARQPKAGLYSSPHMSNTEIMSWLALGHGLESASRNDLQLLSLAASALLSKGSDAPPLTTQLARTFGIDEVTVRSDSALSGSANGSSLAATVVAVGKRLSNRLYLTFERALSGTSTVAKLRYEVGRRWYVQTITGTENALDVFFIFTFD